MNTRNIKLLIGFPVLVFLFIVINNKDAIGAQPDPAVSILRCAFEVNKSIKTLRFTVLMKERAGNNLVQKKTDFKINIDPYRIYLKQHYPNVGFEMLYNKDETGDKTLLNRNSIAFSSLRLDPLGNMIRKESHHSIFKAGFSYILEVLEYLCDKYSDESASYWHYEGLVKYDNVICYKIRFENSDFGYTDYTVLEGENLETISRKLKLCDFMIYENNPQLRSFEDIKPGMKIKVPTDYAREIIVYIDKNRMIPTGLKVYDDKGLFEEYTYQDIVLNPVFSDQDFSSSNPAYGFR